jgi:glycolate oxidase iron-sulfur subunit
VFRLSEIAKANVDTCVHCGLCAEACPTYRELGIEDDSPRGRIHLIRNLHAGTLEPTPRVLEHLDLCLACRACETACPSGVKYGTIIEEARATLEQSRDRSFWAGRLRRLFFRRILPYQGRLKALARTFRLAQRLRLDRAAFAFGLAPKRLRPLAAVATISDPIGSDVLPEVTPAQGRQRYRVAFVQGCITDVMFGPTNLASVRVLAANGCEVVIPKGQTCCGGLPLHAGDREAARAMARQNIDAFLATKPEYIIINAAGCGSTLKEYHHLLADDPVYHEKALDFVTRVRDITEFLAAIDLVPPTRELPLVATYQDACHLAHGQGIRLQPRKLLGLIPGLTLVPLAESDACCGSAGIYNMVQPEMAEAVLGRKMANIAATGARVVVSANTGCIVQLRAGAKQRGLTIEVLHVIDLLDRAYGQSGQGQYQGRQ